MTNLKFFASRERCATDPRYIIWMREPNTNDCIAPSAPRYKTVKACAKYCEEHGFEFIGEDEPQFCERNLA